MNDLTPDQLIALEGSARSAHLMNTAIWPVFTALLLVANGDLTDRFPTVGTNEIRWLFVFLPAAGIYVCFQWWLSVRQSARRYKQLWRTFSKLEADAVGREQETKNKSRLYDIFGNPKSAMWALRGESLPLLLGVIFLYLLILEFNRESATQLWFGVIAFFVFLLLLIGEACSECRENIADEKAFENRKTSADSKAIENGESKKSNDIVKAVDGRSVDGTEYRLITLNNPGKSNCLSLRMFDRLQRSLEETNVALILFNSEGSVFSSGLDLDEIYECGTPKAHLMRLRDLVYAIEGHSATTMSIVSGSVVAGGIAVACCTDVTLAEEEALFSVPKRQEYRPLVRFLKALVFAYRPQADIDPFAERQIHASQAKTLIDETFSYEADDPIEIAVRLAKSPDILKRRIGTRQRKDIDEALSEAIQPAAIEGLLGSRARLHNGN